MADEKGYLLIVLNTHMPYVRNAETEFPQEENWLYEAISESYLPLLDYLMKLEREGVNFRLTISLTPCLIEMLRDPLIQHRYSRYLDDRITLLESEALRPDRMEACSGLVRDYRAHYAHCRQLFTEEWGGDITGAFQALSRTGNVDLLASAATHAYLPVLESYPKLVDLQLHLGAMCYRRAFGQPSTGIWLPECGFYPGLDQKLHENGIKYFFIDAHGLLNGFPNPKYDIHAPVHCPAGVAAFGREWMSHDLVWLKDKGYPGDPYYQNFNRDIGYDLPGAYLSPFTHSDHPLPTGVRYHRNQWVDGSDIYDPHAAFRRCDEHANHFIAQVQAKVEQLAPQMDRKPVLVALFDTEHFGHWWHEGPAWLDLVIRKLAYDQETVRLIHASDYLRQHPTNQVCMPTMSSWGYQGYSESWIMGRNHWIYPLLFEAADRLEELLDENPRPEGARRVALNQYLRELLHAQSSDWAFILHQETVQDYATEQILGAVRSMRTIEAGLRRNDLDEAQLNAMGRKNNLFSDFDLLGVYQSVPDQKAVG